MGFNSEFKGLISSAKISTYYSTNNFVLPSLLWHNFHIFQNI